MNSPAHRLRVALSTVLTDHFANFGAFFRRYLLTRFTSEKVLDRSKINAQWYLKVLLSGIVVAYLTCHEGFKMKRPLNCRSLMFVEWFYLGRGSSPVAMAK